MRSSYLRFIEVPLAVCRPIRSREEGAFKRFLAGGANEASLVPGFTERIDDLTHNWLQTSSAFRGEHIDKIGRAVGVAILPFLNLAPIREILATHFAGQVVGMPLHAECCDGCIDDLLTAT